MWFRWTDRGKLRPVELMRGATSPCSDCQDMDYDPDAAQLRQCPSCHSLLAVWDSVPEIIRDPPAISLEDAFDVVRTFRSTAPCAAELARYTSWQSR